MNIDEILQIKKWADRLAELTALDPNFTKINADRDYYDNKHPILNDPERADYTVTNSQGEEVTRTRTKLVIPFPQKIVESAMALTLGGGVELTLNNEKEIAINEAFQVLKNVWEKEARLNGKNISLFKTVSIEHRAAEVFFLKNPEVPNVKDIRSMVWSLKTGDKVYVHFDDNRTLDAVTRKFTKKSLVNGKATDQEIIQVWTKMVLYESIDGGTNFDEKPNPYEKIPIVYYDQEKSEWELIKPLAEKIEYVMSQNSDANKRVGNTNIVVEGDVDDMGDPENDVKVWKMKAISNGQGGYTYGKMNYLESQNASQGISDELKREERMLYEHSWPNLSILHNSTGQLSAKAIRLMFTDAFAKAVNKRALYEEAFLRRIEILKSMLAKIENKEIYNELNISLKFKSILPEDLEEWINTLSTAVDGGLTSKENAVGLISFNDNPELILTQIKEEQTEGGSMQ